MLPDLFQTYLSLNEMIEFIKVFFLVFSLLKIEPEQEVKCRLFMDSMDYAVGCLVQHLIFSLFVSILAT